MHDKLRAAYRIDTPVNPSWYRGFLYVPSNDMTQFKELKSYIEGLDVLLASIPVSYDKVKRPEKRSMSGLTRKDRSMIWITEHQYRRYTEDKTDHLLS